MNGMLRDRFGYFTPLIKQRINRAVGIKLAKNFQAFLASPHPVQPIMGERYFQGHSLSPHPSRTLLYTSSVSRAVFSQENSLARSNPFLDIVSLNSLFSRILYIT